MIRFIIKALFPNVVKQHEAEVALRNNRLQKKLDEEHARRDAYNMLMHTDFTTKGAINRFNSLTDNALKRDIERNADSLYAKRFN